MKERWGRGWGSSGMGDGRMVWVGWSLDSRLSRPGRHIGASHSKRSRARQVGQGQVGVGVGTGKEGTGQARLIGRNRKVAKHVCCYLRSASTSAQCQRQCVCKCVQVQVHASAARWECLRGAVQCGCRRVERTGNGNGWAGRELGGGETSAWPGPFPSFLLNSRSKVKRGKKRPRERDLHATGTGVHRR